MASEPMVRTIYTDPTSNGLIRQGATAHAESMVDQVKYAQPLERVHGSGLHDWGIGEGLAIAATLNQPGVRVLPGIALDTAGRQVSLALQGKAEVGPNADDPAVAPVLVDVQATGAVLPTAGITGSFFVSVRWRETFDTDLWNSSNQTVFQMLHTPWLKLEPAADITDATDDGSRILLGRVTLAAGNVTALTHERRREAGLPAGSLKFWRGESTGAAPNLKADNVPSAELRARAAGGLELKVPGAADQVEFKRDGGNIAKVAFGADLVVGRTANGTETVVIDTAHGNITLGTQGVEGDVVVKDQHNRRVFVVDGSTASATLGAAGNEGDIRVMDATGQPSMRVDGATGTTLLKRLAPVSGAVIDVDAFAFRIHGGDLVLDGRSGNNKRALVDAGNQLVVNFAGDYANGVQVDKLHLSPHIRTGFWEIDEDGGWRPQNNVWTELFSVDTGLPWSEWDFVTFCEIGMQDKGTVQNFWWATVNRSFRSGAGTIVIKWDININDNGTDWFPSNRKVFWLAFRR
ncbi:hypothetical protein LZ017_04830 [Pelomonas sp. CA6]|uniref:hypothetical protein n=1 Tax=Pelomonas sp. CA6 TaxID=2907999 RepID=UPI001F4A1CD9|nr:hypothetical protein [Pelomonas sp. CA6]MCH7342702.1 hypothetical protein [Pelomonas sp. CA6]